MDMEFDVVFKIDSNCDLEILCICENGLNFTTKKFSIKNSSLDFELFSELIKFDENWTLEGDITKDNFSIKLFLLTFLANCFSCFSTLLKTNSIFKINNN